MDSYPPETDMGSTPDPATNKALKRAFHNFSPHKNSKLAAGVSKTNTFLFF